MNFAAELQLPQFTTAFGIPYDRSREWAPTSALYYCESCGKVFARLTVCDAARRQRPFLAWRMICEECPSPYLSVVPGSIYQAWDPLLMAALPEHVLAREFLLHYAQAKKRGILCPLISTAPSTATSCAAASSHFPSPTPSSTPPLACSEN